MGFTRKEMETIMEGKEELVELIKENSTVLQDEVEIEEGRTFTSHVLGTFESELPSTSVEPVYNCIDSTVRTINDMASDVIGENPLAEIADMDEEENPMVGILRMMGNMKMRIGLSVTASKTATTIRLLKDNDISDSFTYTNVKSADDLLTLVGFHDKKFVDPMLKDRAEIVKVFGA